MDALDQIPPQNSYSGTISDSKQTREYILSEAACAVKKFTDTDLSAIPEIGYQSNDDMSQCIRFPTIWYVRPAKPQISLRICAV